MNFESLFDKILIFYNVKTVTDLADKLKVTRSTVSGWKNRQATGAILEFLFNNDLKALQYIFNSDKNTQTIGSVTNSNVAQNADTQNNSINPNLTDIDEVTFSIFKETYSKLETNEEIKKFRIYAMNFEK